MMTLQGAQAHNGPRDPHMGPRWGYAVGGGMPHRLRWGIGGVGACQITSIWPCPCIGVGGLYLAFKKSLVPEPGTDEIKTLLLRSSRPWPDLPDFLLQISVPKIDTQTAGTPLWPNTKRLRQACRPHQAYRHITHSLTTHSMSIHKCALKTRISYTRFVKWKIEHLGSR